MKRQPSPTSLDAAMQQGCEALYFAGCMMGAQRCYMAAAAAYCSLCSPSLQALIVTRPLYSQPALVSPPRTPPSVQVSL